MEGGFARLALRTVVALLAVVTAGASAAFALPGAKAVLVVVNAANPDSVRIGEYYAAKRGIPTEQLLRLSTLPADPTDGIDRPVFERAIQAPIATWLARNQAQDRIHFIVLTKGIPLRINGGKDGNSAASVDSELAVLYARMAGFSVPESGPAPNPYFLGARPVADAKPFGHDTTPLYLVTRLDGYTVADVTALVDRALAPSAVGRFLLDGRSSWNPTGNAWLRVAAERLKAAGLADDRVVLDETTTVLSDQVDVLGYYSWGSNDPAIRRRTFNLKFRPGAIGGMFVSTDGRTFKEPPASWTLQNDWDDKKTWYAGSPQSLAGDLIREGITGVAGHVSEPLLANTIRPDILFPAYAAGFSLAEAFYLAMPSVSWMTVIVGDPLCAPFAKTPRELEEPPIDPVTELPRYFSTRRLGVLGGPKMPREAAEALLRAESRSIRGNTAGARADLERASKLVPEFLPAQYALALLLEQAHAEDEAIARYRAILQVAPNEWLALNNLAYRIADSKKDYAEALALAERARNLAPNAGAVADTLGWVQHLMGDNAKALPTLKQAATEAPDIAEIRLHLAIVLAATGDTAGAKAEAEKAVALDPSLNDRPDAAALLRVK